MSAKKKHSKNLIPFAVLIPLALLAVPRVVVHDLRLLSFDDPLYKALALIPFIVWGVYALLSKTSKPFRDLFVLGLLYGLFLAITHQITWDASWGSNVPHLGGNLEGKLDPVFESVLLRTAAFISSLVTGAIAGVVLGVIALVRTKITNKA